MRITLGLVLPLLFIVSCQRNSVSTRDATSSPSNASTVANASTVENGVRLNWQSSTGGAGQVTYSIFRNGTLLTTTAATNYLDTTTEPGGDYHYVVMASDSSGQRSLGSTVARVQREN